MSIATEIFASSQALLRELHDLEKKAILASEETDADADVAEALYALDAVLRLAKSVYAQYEAVAIAQLPHETVLGNGATLTQRASTPRKGWKHDDLSKEVAHRIYTAAFDFETGEMLKTVEELITEILKYGAVSYWRVKQLEKLGISPSKYTTPGTPRTSIMITHPK